jgi:electron transfer flavoprotein beta subunit
MADVAVLLSIGQHPASGRPRRADLDARALELALVECTGARLHAIHAAASTDLDASFDAALRDYLGMGPGRMTVLAGGADVESALLAHLRSLRPDLILCGAAAERGEGSGMLPYRLAEALGLPLVASVVSVALRGDTARVVQALPRGARRALRVSLPALLTVDRAAPPARMAAFGPARRAIVDVKVIDPAAIDPAGADGQAGPVLQRQSDLPEGCIERPARARPRRLRTMGAGGASDRLRSIAAVRAGAGSRLQGLDPEQAAQAIWQFLQTEGLTDGMRVAEPHAAAGGAVCVNADSPLSVQGDSAQ